MDLKELKRKIPYQWRVQSFSKHKPVATCVAYIDARDVMDLLDEVVGPENWQSDYKDVDGQMFAGIGIQTFRGIENAPAWVWKWDTGSESNVEAEKGQASDSFKRAAVKWGIGRFLYDLPVRTVAANEVKTDKNFPYVVDEQGKRVWDLTKHLNDIDDARAKRTEQPVAKPVAKPAAKPLPPSNVEAARNAQKVRIKKLLDKGAGVGKLKTASDYDLAALSRTGLSLEVGNYAEIITRLEALQK